MKEIRVLQILSTANHQRNGWSIRKKNTRNRNILTNLPQKDWLPMLQCVLNDATSVSTGKSPHNATFGLNRRSVWNDEKKVELSEKMASMHNRMSMEIKWNREQAKKYFDVEAPNLKRGTEYTLKKNKRKYEEQHLYEKRIDQT